MAAGSAPRIVNPAPLAHYRRAAAPSGPKTRTAVVFENGPLQKAGTDAFGWHPFSRFGPCSLRQASGAPLQLVGLQPSAQGNRSPGHPDRPCRLRHARLMRRQDIDVPQLRGDHLRPVPFSRHGKMLFLTLTPAAFPFSGNEFHLRLLRGGEGSAAEPSVFNLPLRFSSTRS
jgi:hypothetical protein